MKTNNNFVPLTEELLSIHSMNSFTPHSSSPRLSMLSSHLAQAMVITNPEAPIIQTDIENQLAKNTFSKKIENDSRLIAILRRNDRHNSPELTVLFTDLVTGEIDVLVIPKSHSLTKNYGFSYVWSPLLDTLLKGDIIPAGTVLADSTSSSSTGEYRYGLLPNVAFLTDLSVAGDGVIISESYAKRYTHTIFETSIVECGTNEILMNRYGKNGEYKPFPGVGERLDESGVLLVRRTLNDNLNPSMVSSKDVTDFNPDFDIPTCCKLPGGLITDIKVWGNPKTKKSSLTGTTDMIAKYAAKFKDSHNALKRLYEGLTKEHYRLHKNNDLKVSPRLHRLIVEAYAVTESQTKIDYRYKNERLNLYRLEFTIAHTITTLQLGSKVTTLHGGKGVICDIRRDEDMPDGVDMILDPTSIPGRMNVSTLFEHKFNGISRHVKSLVLLELGTTPVDVVTEQHMGKIFDILLGVLKLLEVVQYEAYLNTNLTQRKEILSDIVDNEFYIHRTIRSKSAFTTLNDIKGTIYEPPKKSINIAKGGESVKPIIEPVLVAPLYVVLLAKSPDEFLSAASTKYNHFRLPTGTPNIDKDREPYKNKPTKTISETEGRIFASFLPLKGLAELKDRASSSQTHELMYNKLLTAKHPTAIASIINRKQHPYGTDEALRLVTSIMESSGLELKHVSKKKL